MSGEFPALPEELGLALGEVQGSWRGFSICAVQGGDTVPRVALVRVGSTAAFGAAMQRAREVLERMRATVGLPIGNLRHVGVQEADGRSRLVVIEDRPDGFVAVAEQGGGPGQWRWSRWRDIVRRLLGGVRDLHRSGFAHGGLAADRILVDDSGERMLLDRATWETVHRCFEIGLPGGGALERAQQADLAALVDLMWHWGEAFEAGSQASGAPPHAVALVRLSSAAQLLEYADRLGDAEFRAADEEPAPVARPAPPIEPAPPIDPSPALGPEPQPEPAPEPAPPLTAPPTAGVVAGRRAANLDDDLNQFQTPAFFEAEIRGRVLAWSEGLRAEVDATEVALRRAGGDSVRAVRALVAFLDKVEEELQRHAGFTPRPGAGQDDAPGRHIVQLLLQHLRHCGVRVLPADSVETGLDFDIEAIHGGSLYGVDCQFEFSAAEQPVRAGSVLAIRRVGLDLFGEVLRRGELVISQGVRPPGLDRIENFVQTKPDHLVVPDVVRVRDEVVRNFRRLQGDGSEQVQGFEDALLRLADHLPRQLEPTGSDEYAELREGLGELVRWAGYEIDPPFDDHRAGGTWRIPRAAVVPEFSGSPKGIVIQAVSIGLRRRGTVLKQGRVRISVGGPPDGLAALRDELGLLRSDAAAPLAAAIDAAEDLILERGLVELGLGEGPAEFTREAALAITEGLSIAREWATIDSWPRLRDAIRSLLSRLDPRSALRFIPDLDGAISPDAPARDDLYVIVDERDDHDADVFTSLEPRRFGCWFGGEVVQRCEAEQVNGRRSKVRRWVERARQLLASAGAESDPVERLAQTVEAWGTARSEERFARREAVGNAVLSLLPRVEELATAGVAVDALFGAWDDEFGSILELEVVPARRDVELDLAAEERLIASAERVEARHDLEVSAGRLLEVLRPGVWDAARERWLCAPQVVKSLGPDAEAAELAAWIRACVGADPRLETLAGGLGVAPLPVLLELTAAVAACGEDGALDDAALAARGRAIAGLREALTARGLRYQSPPRDVQPGAELGGFVLQVGVVDEVRQPVEILCPHVLAEDGSVVLQGRLLLRVLRPGLLVDLARSAALRALPGVDEWLQRLEAELQQHGAAPRDDAVWLALLDLLPAHLSGPALDELRQAVTRAGGRLLGDEVSAPAADLSDGEFEVSRHEPADQPAGTPIAVDRLGLATRRRVLRSARVAVSRGPGGPVVDQLERIDACVAEAVAAGELWSDDLERVRSFVGQLRDELRADPVVLGRAPQLLQRLRAEWGRLATTVASAARVEQIRAEFAAIDAACGAAGQRLVDDPAAQPASFSVRHLPQVEGLLWSELLLRPAVLDAAGEVVQRGEAWRVGDRRLQLGDDLAGILIGLREEQAVGALAALVVEQLALLVDADDDARDRMAVKVVHAIVRAGGEGLLERRRVRELCRGVKTGYLESRGWFEALVSVGQPLGKYLPRLAQLAPGESGQQGIVQEVLLPGFATRDGAQVLAPAIVR